MAVALALAMGVAAVAVASGGSSSSAAPMLRRGPKVKAAGPGGETIAEEGTVHLGQIGSWICKKGASKIPIPTPGSILPSQMIQSNVILTAVEAMLGVLKAILNAVGSWACVVLGSKTVYLAQIRGPRVRILVTASVGWKKRAHAAVRWTFSTDDVSSTGELPIADVIEIGDTPTSKSTTYDGFERAHLRDGTITPWAPPKSACGLTCRGADPTWIDLPEEMRMPRVWTLRTGDDIRVWIYIPPRSGHYTDLDGHSQGKRDDDIEWTIKYEIAAVNA